MNAEEFMRGHAEKASTGRIGEILGDLTPEAMAQVGPLMAGAPQPLTGYNVAAAGQDGDDFLFDVTYTGDGGGSVSMRETVRKAGDTWKIVKLERPA